MLCLLQSNQGATTMARFISDKARKAIYERDAMVCCYCAKQCVLATIPNADREQQNAWRAKHKHDFATLDHIVSQWEIAQTCDSDESFRSAIADPSNLVVVCNACNASKKATPLYVWAKRKGFDYAVILHRIAERTGKKL
jgi:hypothetical protein